MRIAREGPTASITARFYDVQIAGGDPAAIDRILTLLRRRSCNVVYVHFDAAGHAGAARLAIGLEPPPGRAHAVRSWLANLVDVMAVDVTP
jgi:acetolactate synthase regulatory subunit